MNSKLTKTEQKVLKLMNEGKKLYEIALVINKPIPVTEQLINKLLNKVF